MYERLAADQKACMEKTSGHLDFFAEQESQFIEHHGIQRIDEGDAHGMLMHRQRQTLIHARRGGRDRLEHFRCQFQVFQTDHFRAEMVGEDLELGAHVHELEILENLADGLAAARVFLQDFIHLQVVDQSALFDER